MKNFMRDFAIFKDKINPSREFRIQARIDVVNDIEKKMKELEAPYKILERVKHEAERMTLWR